MNKFSINKWESMRGEDYVEVPVNGLDGVTMTVKYALSLMEMLQLVEDVVSTCFPGEGEFRPEMRDFAFRTGVLTSYANFNMPKDISKQYDLLYNTDAYDQVVEHINQAQYVDIIAAIGERIDHERSKIESQSGLRALEILDKVEELSNQLDGVFNGIDSAAWADILGKIKTISDMDERELAHAVIAERKSEEEAESEKSNKVVKLKRK